MSSRSGTPDVDDSLSDVFGAMAQSSPVAPPRPDKRPHSAIDDDTSDNEDVPAQISLAPNQNIAAAATRYAERKRLKPDQKADVDAFLNVSFPCSFFSPF
jgi:hypothetical protein